MARSSTSFDFGVNRRRRQASRFKFHGAYTSKEKAMRKERSRKGAFIISRRVRGSWRYIVMTAKGGKRK